MKTKLGTLCLVLSLTLGLTQETHAQTSELPQLPYGKMLSCYNEGSAVGASYFRWGGEMVVNLIDNYISTQHQSSDGTTNFMKCTSVYGNIQCRGAWAYKNVEVVATLVQKSPGQYAARFNRYYGGLLVEAPCVLRSSWGDEQKLK